MIHLAYKATFKPKVKNMHNEIQRKITSLTLMTIMVAGGVTFGIPGVMPAAEAANPNLFVSAENSQFENHIAGPQVIEVVVDDPGSSDTDQGEGEPNVEINGNDLRMVQATDGRWYAYFASLEHAQIADSLAPTTQHGLNYGTFCSSDSTILGNNIRVTDTEGIAIPILGGAEGTDSLKDCLHATEVIDDPENQVGIDVNANTTINVIREPKTPSSHNGGQIGLNTNLWPFIQLYTFTEGGNIVIEYEKGGGTQSATFTFDTVDDFAGLQLDRTFYPKGSQVHITVTDTWLNIDPTDEDSWTYETTGDDEGHAYYDVFGEGNADDPNGLDDTGVLRMMPVTSDHGLMQEFAQLKLEVDTQDSRVIDFANNADANVMVEGIEQPVTLTESSSNSGVFGTYDDSDESLLVIDSDAARGNSATIDYNDDEQTILVGFEFATIDIQPVNEVWSSGEEIPVILVDGDANKNSRSDEIISITDPDAVIPSLRTGNPFTLNSGDKPTAFLIGDNPDRTAAVEVQTFSDRAIVSISSETTPSDTTGLLIDLDATMADLRNTIQEPSADKDALGDAFKGYNLFNYNVDSLGQDITNVELVSITDRTAGTHDSNMPLIASDSSSGLVNLSSENLDDPLFGSDAIDDDSPIGILYTWDADKIGEGNYPIVTDFMSFGFTDDGDEGSERVANQIVRFELEEDADNSATFVGTLEYVMINQLNILDASTYEITPDSDGPIFIVMEDLTDEDDPRINYLDLGADGVSTQVADQQPAPSHSGVVSFDSDTYKVADTVTITLDDADLNVDSGLIDIFTTVDPDDYTEQFMVTDDNGKREFVADKTDRYFGESGKPIAVYVDADQAVDMIGKPGLPGYSFGSLGRLLDITFNDEQWLNSKTVRTLEESATVDDRPNDICVGDRNVDDGLGATGIRMIETGVDSGTFVGDFQIPAEYCARSGSTAVWASVTGTDIEVNYVDFRDASGEIIEVGDSAGIRANTGTISLDRTVYPVPWGDDVTTNDGSVFPLHTTATGPTVDEGETLGEGILTIHARVSDPDFDISAAGEDVIETDLPTPLTDKNGNTVTDENGDPVYVGPVEITVSRGGASVVLAYAGGSSPGGNFNASDGRSVQDLGAILETAPDSGVFELDFNIGYADGPESNDCPTTPHGGCVLQGDILTVQYTDPTDASGDPNTVTDSATFDLRNGVLQSDKSVYIIGSDMILTIIEPDWDLESDAAETYSLDILEWDSAAATVTMGDLGGNAAAFDPEPNAFRETGDSSGIFQVVVETPEELGGDRLERGEQIDLEYTDWGPSGADYVGQEDEDISLTVFTSNFGATVELDQKVYTWTDKVYITVVAPDHNNDSDLIDEIGENSFDPVRIATGVDDLDRYKLVETGTDTGIFTGEVILTGFDYNADGDLNTGEDDTGYDTNPRTGDATGNTEDGLGPTDGFLESEDSDGISVSFEFSDGETVVSSSLIRWNIGEVTWLEASYPASGSGVLRVVDPDMNLNPESVDNFDVDVRSDSDAGGIDLTVTETNEATGIFEGTVFFTLTDASSGHRLRISEGDTVTGYYDDHTLPEPYDTGDSESISASTLIGTLVPPLERAPATNLRITDATGGDISDVSVGTQIQVVADLQSGQDQEQPYIYLVQVKNADNTVVSLGSIGGDLAPGQSMTPSQLWTPNAPGVYTAEVFVWESLNNPTPLSPSLEIPITIN